MTHWTLHGARERNAAIEAIEKAPALWRVEIREPRRSDEQSAKMWAMLDELSAQLDWHGQTYSAEDWKDYMMHALKRARWMPFEDGGMVPIGMRTSRLSFSQMSELIELISEFGARHSVQFKEPKDEIQQARYAGR